MNIIILEILLSRMILFIKMFIYIYSLHIHVLNYSLKTCNTNDKHIVFLDKFKKKKEMQLEGGNI